MREFLQVALSGHQIAIVIRAESRAAPSGKPLGRWNLHLTLRFTILEGTLNRFDGRNGAVAQLGERRVRNAEVEGSIPFRSIGFFEQGDRSSSTAQELRQRRKSVRSCFAAQSRGGRLALAIRRVDGGDRWYNGIRRDR